MAARPCQLPGRRVATTPDSIGRQVEAAHFGVSGRHASRRASDYIRAFPDKRLTLSDVRVYRKGSADLYDAAPFMIVNLDVIDLIYAREPNAGRITEEVLEAEEEA